MNLDEALTYQALQHAYKPKSCPRWEAGLEAESRPREGNLTIFFITDKLGEPLLGSLPIVHFQQGRGRE